jgi:WD40 repeat protein
MKTASCPDQALLREHLDGSLPSGAEAEMVAHLDGCERCRQALESLASGGQAWLAVARGLGEEPPIRPASWERIVAPLDHGSGAATEPELAPLLTTLGLADEAGRLGRLDHYGLQEVIGRGTMGVVFKAFDEKLRRTVAVKVMSPLWAANRAARQRFFREARAAAAIRDEHVVAVHAVEEFRGLPYLVTDYIPGGSLQHRIEDGRPLPIEEVVRIGRDVALGLAAAHAMGLVHRDVKPANILLDDASRRAKIVDFGLARTPDDAGLTHDGIVVGTPQFMAPEQARGEPVDHRADLFSLGSVLYTLCTGQTPFAAGSPLSVLRRIAEEVPTPLWELKPEVPEWLDRLIAALLAKEPADRISTAAAVADLLDGRVGPPASKPGTVPWRSTRPASPGGRRRSLRRPMVAAAVLLAAASLGLSESFGVTHLGATLIRVFTPDGVLAIAVDDPDIKVSIEGEEGIVITGPGLREVRLKPGSYRLSATREGKTVREEVVTITRGGKRVVTINREPSPPSHPVGPVVTLSGRRGFWSVALLSDGRRAVSGGLDDTVGLWDLEAGGLLYQFRHGVEIWCVAPTPDGRFVLSAGADRSIRVWDLEARTEARPFKGHDASVQSAVMSRDGRYVLSGSQDRTMRLWDFASRAERRCFRGHTDTVRTVAFVTDGRRAVSGSHDGTVRLWDIETGDELRRFTRINGVVHCAAVSPDGRRVIAGGMDKTIRIWDLESGELLRSIRLPAPITWLAFSPDGRRFLSGGWDWVVRLLDAETGDAVRPFDGHSEPVTCVTFAADGRRALSCSWDCTIRLWQLPP